MCRSYRGYDSFDIYDIFGEGRGYYGNDFHGLNRGSFAQVSNHAMNALSSVSGFIFLTSISFLCSRLSQRTSLSSLSTWRLSILAGARSHTRSFISISFLTCESSLAAMSRNLNARQFSPLSISFFSNLRLIKSYHLYSATFRQVTREEQDRINKNRKSVRKICFSMNND